MESTHNFASIAFASSVQQIMLYFPRRSFFLVYWKTNNAFVYNTVQCSLEHFCCEQYEKWTTESRCSFFLRLQMGELSSFKC